MSKIVYSARYGGFGLSEAAARRYAEIKGIEIFPEQDPLGFTVWWTVPEAERPGQPNGGWQAMSMPERQAYNAAYSAAVLVERDIPRDDPALVQVVEELGAAANSRFSDLKIAEVPAGTLYRIDEYDGFESVETVDSYDWKVAP